MQGQEQVALGAGDIPQLFQCLRAALGTDEALRKSAEATLQSFEGRPGFCSCLAEILSSKEADHSARWLAAVHFKNTSVKTWKPRLNRRGITAEEKQHLRQKLLTLIDQDDAQLAVQVALVFAKVARTDYPKEWPTLFAELTSRLQSGSTLTVRRVYLALHHILKELSSKRLAADQRTFAEVTQSLLEPYWNQWQRDTETILTGLPAVAQRQEQPQLVALTLERWLLELKGLRRMVLFGFPSDATSFQTVPAVLQVAPALLRALQQLLPLRRSLTGPSQISAMLDRCILKVAKSMTDILGLHPWSLYDSGTVQPALDFFCSQLILHPTQQSEALAMRCMIFIHHVFKCPSYRGASSGVDLRADANNEDEIKARASKVQSDLEAFWRGDRLQMLCSAIVQSYLLLKAKDMQAWREEPERFHHEAESSAWEDHLPSCAQVLLGVLMEAHRQQLAPVLVSMLHSIEAACPAGQAANTMQGPRIEGVPSAVLAKEAVYNAVGTCSYDLYDFLDFPSWFRSALAMELANESWESRPLCRRALLLLGQWTAKLAGEDRPAVYRTVLHLMSNQDAALQLAAVSTLQALVDDWDFREEQFVEVAGVAFSALTPLLQCTDDYDAQMQVFNLINAIIDRLGDSIRPFAQGLMALLPSAWEAAEGHSLLRMQILVSLQRLVHALGTDSWACYPLLMQLLPHCTDINQPDELNLLEDGLQLWAVALCNAPRPEPQLLNLFPNLVAILQRSTEMVQPAMQITTSCILLGGASFLQVHGQALATMLAGLIGNVKDRGMLLLIPVMELVLQVAPEQGPMLLRAPLQRLLGDILSGQESPIVEAAAMAVFARLLLHNGNFLLEVFVQAGSLGPSGRQWPESFLQFLDQWLDRFDIIATDGQRKLSALALCVLLHLQLAPLLQRLELLVTHITSVWIEVEGGPNTAEDRPHFGYDFFNASRPEDHSSALLAAEEAECEIDRRRQLHAKDPVNQIKLSSFLKDNINQGLAVNGEKLKAAMDQLDPALINELQKVLA
ncbi:hypothetical protein WJX73_002919 [Symbiochloris irregularis]|uniref:Importin N-terminal domain-containing protein n=1 Tax=Symbiochloris irregularis TaxID=706552 RepID=A0AAW1NPL9_9CHLO